MHYDLAATWQGRPAYQLFCLKALKCVVASRHCYENFRLPRVPVGLSSDKADVVLPVLERWTALMRQVQA